MQGPHGAAKTGTVVEAGEDPTNAEPCRLLCPPPPSSLLHLHGTQHLNYTVQCSTLRCVIRGSIPLETIIEKTTALQELHCSDLHQHQHPLCSPLVPDEAAARARSCFMLRAVEKCPRTTYEHGNHVHTSDKCVSSYSKVDAVEQRYTVNSGAGGTKDRDLRTKVHW